ncbi:RNA-binding protein pop5 [Entomophthora muscae]|uniref:RNA-binding protein pop5 n=1 Tax=Entomophthora muscae TaxID=34485 RepID=A0ACC2RR61_9FUNG|nr:RNA-binding protein pop5 [Entomophthora muscae]
MVRYRVRYLLFELQLEQQNEVLASRMVENLSSEDVKCSKDAYESKIDAKSIERAIRSSLNLNFGDIGSSKIMRDLNIKYFNVDTHLGLLRTGRSYFRMLWASMTLINSLNEIPCSFRVIHVSGTIKKCQLATKIYDRKVLINLALIIAAQKETNPQKVVEQVKAKYVVPAIPVNSFDD